MRISTPGLYQNALTAMLDQQSRLAKTQNQVATGKRVQTPADDPVAAVHIMQLQRAQAESDQYQKNSDSVTTRLNLEEQGLADTTTLLQRVRELTVEAGNVGTMSDSDRQSLVAELQARSQELMDIANRKDANGEYLFSGFASLTQPFSRSGTVSYAGDQGVRQIQVSPSQKIADSDTGDQVFQNITQGNGTFTTSAGIGNTGTASIDVGTVVNAAAWVPDNYTITFVSASDYQITDSASNVVASGTAAPGSAISFNGVQVTLTGTPAVGDSFAVSKSGKEDIFSTLDKLIATLQRPASTAAGKAQMSTAIGGALQQLDQADTHIENVRAGVGARLSLLDDASSTRDATNVDLQSTLSNLQDLDYASALTKLQQQLVGLQAAQQSYSKISQLSLFSYL